MDEIGAADRFVALVTGGSSGIGRAVVADLSAHGYAVVVLDQTAPREPLPGATTLILGDVCDPDANVRAVEAALHRHGRLDLLVGNAGVHDGGLGLLDVSGPDLAAVARRILDVDVIGYMLAARAAVDALRIVEGAMVFTLSDASFVVRGNGSGLAYAAAKHAALGLVRHLAADLAPHVRVNAVAPGGVVTDLQAVTPGGGATDVFVDPTAVSERIRAANPLQVCLRPDQIAPLYRLLGSAATAGMTGEVWRPDGGLSVR